MPLKREYLEHLQKNIPEKQKSKSIFYEKLGDKWAMLSPKDYHMGYRREDLEYAIKNYTRALKLTKGTEKAEERIFHKINRANFTREHLKPVGIGIHWKVTSAVLSVVSLIVALLSVSLNITGNAIGNISNNSFKWIGICFFALGLIFTFLFLKDKNKNF